MTTQNLTKQELAIDLLNYINNSPVNFIAVENLKKTLLENGFSALEIKDKWELKKGGKYYVTQNGSALFAFILGDNFAENGFKLICSHSDSPGFRIKPNPEITSEGGIVKLNTEVYGGPILYTWFDRPLSIAGRVIIKSDNP